MEVDLAGACSSARSIPKCRFSFARGPCFLRLRSRMLVKHYGVSQYHQDADVQDRKPVWLLCTQPASCTPLSGSVKQLSRLQRRNCQILAATGGEGLSYKDAGVDIDAGNELVRRIKKMNPSIGGFSGMVPFGDSYLVAGTDGVGTKLKLAFDLGKHDTIGIDLVAMSVNDIITAGAKPLFFLDYFATGQLDVDVAEAVVKGIVEGCRQSGCPLLGGETAEMPGFYGAGEYDVAGFAVGSVQKDRVIDGSRIVAGDVLLGLPSSGVHSNGFSLVRRVLEVSKTGLQDPLPWGGPGTLGEALLTPTTIYVETIISLLGTVDIKGLVHITGGGFPENIPRVLPNGLGVSISRSSWEIPPLFRWIQQAGNVSEAEMFRTFNMGVGMVIIVKESDAAAVEAAGVGACQLGRVVDGQGVAFVA